MYLFAKVSLLNDKNNYKKHDNLFLIKSNIIDKMFKIKYKKTHIIFDD